MLTASHGLSGNQPMSIGYMPNKNERGINMSRERTYGDVTVVFSTAKAAEDFDNYLNTETTIYYGGKEIGKFKPIDNFNQYKFFGIECDGKE